MSRSSAMKNLFCNFGDLANESDVEQSFARRLLEALDYPDRAIRTKATLERLTVGRLTGDTHKPDFALKVAGHIRWVLEAKSPGENLADHIEQARDYCNAINASYSQAEPVRYFVLTNAKSTVVYSVGADEPFLKLDFADFAEGNPLYESFTQFLRFDEIAAGSPVNTSTATLSFTKPGIAEINRVFASCHQKIYNSDRISQAAAFVEFVKLITLKLLSDKQIKDKYPGVVAESQFEHPADEVNFSVSWIEKQTAANPISSILFREFMDDFEKQILKKIRKRFFDQREEINLKPETIKGVVESLESLYLFGIDADLNGRMFENFLSATMRGRDLGQYFTPRTLVKLGVGLADLEPSDRILDGCCGTGGFLIDALADMWGKVNNNPSLSESTKAKERKAIADERIYGIDFANDPNLAKIARLNMYLHGDGGSRIFNVDSLDLEIGDETGDSNEVLTEKLEMRKLDLESSFDVVLTNPPFSKKYDRDLSGDKRVLDQYDIAKGKQTILAKLMFFEMYHHYLKPGGRLVSVIDDGFLTGRSHKWFRDTLRTLYTIKAVVSLPGDAFQRSEARVKTSFVVLEKRLESDPYKAGHHPSIFMYACRYVGIDDPKRNRWMPGDEENRQNAVQEVAEVVAAYEKFKDGDDAHAVSARRTRDRLDVKHCLMEHQLRVPATKLKLKDVAELKSFDKDDIIVCAKHDKYVQSLTVRYDGTAEAGDTLLPKTDTKYLQLRRVASGDLVVSNIAATYGSVAVVPANLSGHVVSKEYTVLTVKPGYEARVVWALLRSPEIRAELLLRTTGANRTRIRWSDIQDISFPYPDNKTAKAFLKSIEEAEQAIACAQAEHIEAITRLNEALSLDNEEAHRILDAFKPPT